jgi:tetratricopeptide (TPR) repeat protein
MPPQTKIDPRRDYVRRYLPWLVAVVMLVIFLGTLNPWVSLFNLDTVARISGWIWQPDFGGPLFHLITLPFRVLPIGMIPVALNLFSALCAALTLGLLARSVALLPHDRTEPQTLRERSDFALLTLWSAWLPPVLAALLCGLQLTFWEYGTNGGSDMFDLLLFAVVIWQLLEYRLDRREWRLFLSSVIMGAGMAEGGAMLAFLPVFITAIIWLRGLTFFNLRFLGRMMLCGLAGFSLFLLLPLVAVISDRSSGTFLQALKYGLGPQIQVLKVGFICVINASAHFEDIILPIVISLVPLLLLSIRWKIGDTSRIGSGFTNLTFHGIHAIFLVVCVWLVFDPPFSPREKGLGLTLYYLIALNAGYYAGYFLLVFGKKHPRAGEFQPIVIVLFNRAVVGCVWLLAILAVAGLFYKNGPLIRMINNRALGEYASLISEKLPDHGAILLSDNREQLYLTEAALAREGRAKNFLLLDTTSLLYPEYHRYLHRESPEKWPLLIASTNSALLSPIGMVGLVSMVGQSNDLYYLHPSFGYYFERFYAEPHGLVYRLKPLPDDTLLPPKPGEDLVAENETFWAEARTQNLKSVEDALSSPARKPQSFVQKQLARLHVPNEPNTSAQFIGSFCSRSMDAWGVELQQAGDLTNAADCFKTALQFYPDNVVAQINLGFNGKLQAGQTSGVDLSETSNDHLGKFDSVTEAITDGGPFDEPSFCYDYGRALVEDNKFVREAVAPLARVCELDPHFFPARALLANIYGLNHLPDRMLEVLRDPLDHPKNFSLDLANSTQIRVLAATAYFQKSDAANGSRLFDEAVSLDPGNDTLASHVEQFYITQRMYTNALGVAERRLNLSPNDPQWLFAKGYLENQLKRYNDAIVTLDRVIALQQDNSKAIFQRARAYYLTGNLSGARADYETLQQSQTNSYLLAYALGEIARKQHDTNAAIRNLELYLGNAPTNTAEMKMVMGQLQELQQPTADK